MSNRPSSPQPVPASPHLDRLPFEVTSRLATFLTRAEAFALCLVCRSLLDAGESKLYRSLDLIFRANQTRISVDPDLYGNSHRATTLFRDRAGELGDARVQGNEANYDLLQGGLRLYSRLFNRRPERRKFVREIYAECSNSSAGLPNGMITSRQIAVDPTPSSSRTQPDPTISLDIKRTFRTLGTLPSATKVTLKVYYQWEDYLRQFLIIAPNVQRIALIPGGRLAEQVGKFPDLPRLRHFAMENLYAQLCPLATKILERCRMLEGLVVMDWEAQREARAAQEELQIDTLAKAIEKRRGTRMLFLPIKMFDRLKSDELRNTQVLGIQGPYHPSLRFADLTIPSLPRLRRLFLFLNRLSTFSPFYTAIQLPESSAITSAPIHSTLLSQIEKSPKLVDIHLSNLLSTQPPQGRVQIHPSIAPSAQAAGAPASGHVQIRTFARSGDKFTHVRVTSNQVYTAGQWMLVSRGSVVQDWTDYRGLCVPPDALERVYEASKLDLLRHRGGRKMTLREEGWKVLEQWWGSQ